MGRRALSPETKLAREAAKVERRRTAKAAQSKLIQDRNAYSDEIRRLAVQLVFEGHCCAWQYESFLFLFNVALINFIYAKRPINLRTEGQRHHPRSKFSPWRIE
jgi:hypothetical protein